MEAVWAFSFAIEREHYHGSIYDFVSTQKKYLYKLMSEKREIATIMKTSSHRWNLTHTIYSHHTRRYPLLNPSYLTLQSLPPTISTTRNPINTYPSPPTRYKTSTIPILSKVLHNRRNLWKCWKFLSLSHLEAYPHQLSRYDQTVPSYQLPVNLNWLSARGLQLLSC